MAAPFSAGPIRSPPEPPELSAEEAERLQRAFRDPQFQALFAEFAAELADPAQRCLYEQEVAALERERGVELRFLHPAGGFVLLTSQAGSRRCYINVCSDPAVAAPQARPEPGGRRLSLPYALPPGREEPGRRRRLIYDVVFHPAALRLAARSARFRRLLAHTAMDAVERHCGVSLDRANAAVLRGTRYRGVPQAHAIRTPLSPDTAAPEPPDVAQEPPAIRTPVRPSAAAPEPPDIDPEPPGIDTPQHPDTAAPEPPASCTPLRPSAAPEPPDITLEPAGTPLHPDTAAPEPPSIHTPPRTSAAPEPPAARAPPRPSACSAELPPPAASPRRPGPTTPRWSIVHRSYMDLQDYQCGRAGGATRRELEVSVELPLLPRAAALELELRGRELLLRSARPAYRLQLRLPCRVDEDRGRAVFCRESRQLRLTLPLLPGEDRGEPGAEQRVEPELRVEQREPGAEQREEPELRVEPREPGAEQREEPELRVEQREPGEEQRKELELRVEPREPGEEQREEPELRMEPREPGAEQREEPELGVEQREPGAEQREEPELGVEPREPGAEQREEPELGVEQREPGAEQREEPELPAQELSGERGGEPELGAERLEGEPELRAEALGSGGAVPAGRRPGAASPVSPGAMALPVCPPFQCRQDEASVALVLHVPGIQPQSLRGDVGTNHYCIRFSSGAGAHALFLRFAPAHRLASPETSVSVSSHNAAITLAKAPGSTGHWQKFCFGLDASSALQERLFVSEENVDGFLDAVSCPSSCSQSALESQPLIEVLDVTEDRIQIRLKPQEAARSERDGKEETLSSTGGDQAEETKGSCPQTKAETHSPTADTAEGERATETNRTSMSLAAAETIGEVGFSSHHCVQKEPSDNNSAIPGKSGRKELDLESAVTGDGGAVATESENQAGLEMVGLAKAGGEEAAALAGSAQGNSDSSGSRAASLVLQEVNTEDGSVRIIRDHVTCCPIVFQNPLLYELD
ncbi:protein kintoun [Cuculus canorus]|nr:protein kintoun [Cuculus canorus]